MRSPASARPARPAPRAGRRRDRALVPLRASSSSARVLLASPPPTWHVSTGRRRSAVALVAVAAAASPDPRLPARALALARARRLVVGQRAARRDRPQPAGPLLGTAERAQVVVDGAAAPPRFELRAQAERARFGGLRLESPSCSSFRSGARRRRVTSSTCSVCSRRRRAGARLRRADLAAPPRHPRGAAGDRWRVVGRRGGLGGVADGCARSARAVSRARQRGRAAGCAARASCSATTRPVARASATASGLGPLPPAGGSGQNVALVAGGALLVAWLSGSRGSSASSARSRDRGVRARGRRTAVGGPGRDRRCARLDRVAARPRARPLAFLLVGALVLLAWNPYTLLDAGLPALVRGGAWRSSRSRPDRPRARGLSGAAEARGLPRDLDGVRPRDGADPLAAVPRRSAARGAGERARRAGGRPAPRPCADRSRRPSRRAVRRAALTWLAGWCAAYLAFCARLIGGLPFAQVRSARAAAAIGLGAALAGAYAWRRCRNRAEACLPARRQRPTEGRARSRALRSHFDPRARSSASSAAEASGEEAVARVQRAWPVRRRLDGSCSSKASTAGRRRTRRRSPTTSRAPTPDTVLALVGEELKKDRRSRRRAPRSGDVLVYGTPRSGTSPRGSPSSSSARRQGRARGVPAAGRARRRGPVRARHRGRQARDLGRRRRDPRAEVEALVAAAGRDAGRGHSRTPGRAGTSAGVLARVRARCSSARRHDRERSSSSAARRPRRARVAHASDSRRGRPSPRRRSGCARSSTRSRQGVRRRRELRRRTSSTRP